MGTLKFEVCTHIVWSCYLSISHPNRVCRTVGVCSIYETIIVRVVLSLGDAQ